MKSCGKFRNKGLFSSESGLKAVTPIIGSLLMLLILVVLAGATAIIVFNSAGESENSQPLIAKITIESCEGGLYGVGPTAERVRLEENRIVLMHEGGDSLPFDTVSVIISGHGNSFKGDVGEGGTSVEGNTEVLYKHLNPKEKNNTYVNRNSAVLEDNLWDVGEKLILCGQDSSKYINSSVKVSVNGGFNTSDNYGFKAGSEIIVKIIDVKSSNVIAQQRAIVKHAD
ncbi:type IV pilin [Methanosarcina sp. MSH10X1]|nr:type IV pilin [Methanosarcina sp. MSH10X1]